MKKATVEMAVGVFVLIGIVAISYMTIKLGKMELFGDNYYPVKAEFSSVSGLRTGAQVEMAGVEIGKVKAIELDRESQMALIHMNILKTVQLSDDVIASIKTSGLIGDKYIKISPGGSDDMLKAGDIITDTESALDIEELVSKYVFGDVK